MIDDAFCCLYIYPSVCLSVYLFAFLIVRLCLFVCPPVFNITHFQYLCMYVYVLWHILTHCDVGLLWHIMTCCDVGLLWHIMTCCDFIYISYWLYLYILTQYHFIFLLWFLRTKVSDNDFFYFSINQKLRHNTADHQVADVMSRC